MLQAQSSVAKVLGLCNARAHTQNCIKQAREFGVTGSMRVVAILIQSGDVRPLGPGRCSGNLLDRVVLLGPERPYAHVER
jgi:branched-chain amino acid transport system substrate-binding protein